MSTHQSPFRAGGLFGFRYLFEEPGDGLILHRHEKQHEHLVIGVRGSVLVNGPEIASKIVRSGDVHEIPAGELHQIVALDPGSSVLNLYLHGFPEEYSALTDADFRNLITTKPGPIEG